MTRGKANIPVHFKKVHLELLEEILSEFIEYELEDGNEDRAEMARGLRSKVKQSLIRGPAVAYRILGDDEEVLEVGFDL